MYIKNEGRYLFVWQCIRAAGVMHCLLCRTGPTICKRRYAKRRARLLRVPVARGQRALTLKGAQGGQKALSSDIQTPEKGGGGGQIMAIIETIMSHFVCKCCPPSWRAHADKQTFRSFAADAAASFKSHSAVVSDERAPNHHHHHLGCARRLDWAPPIPVALLVASAPAGEGGKLVIKTSYAIS